MKQQTTTKTTMKRKHLWTLLLVVGLMLLTACENEDEAIVEVTTSQSAEVQMNDEGLLPITHSGNDIYVQDYSDYYLFEGDIMIAKDSSKSVGMTAIGNLWPEMTVYYGIDPNLSGQYRVTDAIKHWEDKTNLKFAKRTTQSAYVYFTTGNGCSSYVGRTGFKQNISLANGCSTGSTIHEIGHAIGLFHEQSREDRNEHVKILWDNIRTGYEYNFQAIRTYYSYAPRDLTDNLDFPSIMMYGSYSFSSNGQPTIVKLDGSTYRTNRIELSAGDIAGVELLYPTKIEPVVPEYVNGKFYTISGLTVLRYYNSWYWYGKYGWKALKLVNGIWYYR